MEYRTAEGARERAGGPPLVSWPPGEGTATTVSDPWP